MHNNNENWTDCPQGTLRQVANRGTAVKREGYSPYLVGAAIGLLLSVGLFGWSAINGDSTSPAPANQMTSSLKCSEVMPLLAQYHRDELDQYMSHEIGLHMLNCEKCSKYYADNFPPETASLEDFRNWLVMSGQIQPR
ncbi:MAG: hypothetical protein AAF497_04650 [Planctomycetota bacterium]